jgi:diguanylate cyclase (GGDEF)-like protein
MRSVSRSADVAAVVLDPVARAANACTVDVSTLVAPSAGVSLVVDAAGAIIAQSPAAALLADDDRARLALERLALSAQVTGAPERADVLTGGAPMRRFDACALPIHGPDGQGLVWITATETSLKDHLIDALKASRAMFRDLAEAAGEIGFALDAQGCFSYIRPPGALGYAAWELNGVPVTQWGAGAAMLITREKMGPQDVWLMDRARQPVCLSVVTVPVLDGDSFMGVRGVARDVTQERLASLALAAAERRETLFLLILAAGREETTANRIRERALDALLQGMAADAVRFTPPGAEPLERGVADPAHIALRAPCYAGEKLLGHIVIARHGSWDMDAPAMLIRAADALSLVLLHADHMTALEQLSLTDGLTGLPNRRAFETEVARRLAQRARRATRGGALLLIDLDHFKALNDRFGHAEGDHGLKVIADVLQSSCRQTDIPARLGGDEFALWLDGSDVAGATRVAQNLLTLTASARAQIAGGQVPLSLSIGIAPACDPNDDLAMLLKRADDALYCVKRAGRNSCAVWSAKL